MKSGCALVGLDYFGVKELLIARDSIFPLSKGAFIEQIVMLGRRFGGCCLGAIGVLLKPPVQYVLCYCLA